MTVYEKIDKALKQHENHKYYERSLESIADYIDWTQRWCKITDEVCDRISVLLERDKLWKN